MIPPELTPFTVLVCALGFLGGGWAKGAVGGGLPAVAVPVMATVIEPALAVALTLVPVALANIWQALQGGHYREALSRYWRFTLAFGLGVALGTQILVALDPRTMALAMGLLVIVSTGLQWRTRTLTVTERAAGWLDPAAGLAAGLVGGATAMFAPLIVYFSARRLPKDLLVAQASLSMVCASVPLYLTLAVNKVLTWDEAGLSALAFVPAALGLMAGTWVRGRISQPAFERLLLVALLLLGLALVAKGLR